jgi:hypothetical protein
MSNPNPKKSSVFSWVILSLFVIPLAGCLSLDLIARQSARPPSHLKTISEFREWKGKSIRGERIYENSGTNYTVMLAPAGRMLASGPAAYLFDQSGVFIDWTADMGDLRTKKYGMKLSGGAVKKVEPRGSPTE